MGLYGAPLRAQATVASAVPRAIMGRLEMGEKVLDLVPNGSVVFIEVSLALVCLLVRQLARSKKGRHVLEVTKGMSYHLTGRGGWSTSRVSRAASLPSEA